MLIQFRVENHRSLRDECMLSMVAANIGDKKDRRLIRANGVDEALLPAVAIYGANASGKSNVISALMFMRQAIVGSHRWWEPETGTPQDPFALSNKAEKPSLFEADILVGGVRYQYGFVLSSARIEEEWLYAWPRGRKQSLLEREGDAFEFGKHLPGENETIRALTRSNSLYLSAAAQNNHAVLMPVFRWFAEASFVFRGSAGTPRHFQQARLAEIFGDNRQLSLFPVEEEAREWERNAIVKLLQSADIGVTGIKVVDREEHSARRGSRRPSGPRTEVLLSHKTESGEGVWLPLEDESAGTVTLLSVAPALLHSLKYGTLLCIDELEASLHPTLALQLARMYNDPKQNPQHAQVIFTTHDTNLLGNMFGEPTLRRDQVWLTEKDPNGATHVYPLTDFQPRKEENLERGYLQGRYGAIPFLSNLLPPFEEGDKQ